MGAYLLDFRQLRFTDLVASSMAIDRDHLRRLEPMKYVRRVSHDDLLVALATQEISRCSLAGRVQMYLRLVNREHVGRALSQIEERHGHELANAIRLFHQ